MKRRDLALEYFPGKKPVEAVRNLRRWINNCPKLKEELLACFYRVRGEESNTLGCHPDRF